MSKDIDYYLALPYPVEIIPDDEGYVARIPLLPGAIAHGATVQEAYDTMMEVKTTYLEIQLDYGWPIAEPLPERE